MAIFSNIGGKWCGKASSPLVFIVAYNTEHRLFRIQAALSNIIPFTRVNHDHLHSVIQLTQDRTEQNQAILLHALQGRTDAWTYTMQYQIMPNTTGTNTHNTEQFNEAYSYRGPANDKFSSVYIFYLFFELADVPFLARWAQGGRGYKSIWSPSYCIKQQTKKHTKKFWL